MKRYSQIQEGEKFYIVDDFEKVKIFPVIYEYEKGVEHCLQVYEVDGDHFDPTDDAPISNFLQIESDPMVCASYEEAKKLLTLLTSSPGKRNGKTGAFP